MEKLLEKIAIGIMVLAIASPVVMAVETYTDTITATANVVALCGVEASPNIAFGDLVPGATSGTSTVNVTNDGLSNTPSSDVTVEGITWSDGTHTMAVGQTEYKDDSIWVALTGSPVTIFGGLINAASSKYIDFQVKIPGNQPVGLYTQTITFTLECNQD
jgi:spore coat protein U-like protein